MKLTRAFKEAIKFFEKNSIGEIRTVEAWDLFGLNNNYKTVKVHIGYAIDGDYIQSYKNPYVVDVCDQDGKIIVFRCN